MCVINPAPLCAVECVERQRLHIVGKEATFGFCDFSELAIGETFTTLYFHSSSSLLCDKPIDFHFSAFLSLSVSLSVFVCLSVCLSVCLCLSVSVSRL